MPDLTELQRLAEGATPGPWAYDRGVIPPDGPGRYSTVSAEDGDLTIAEVNDLIPDGIANADYIAAMHPDTAKKLIAVARAGLSAHREIQRFKMRWLNLPTFADKLNKTTRQAMTMAHQPIMMAEEVLRAALEELK